jgi:LacI family transcriptional regulator
MKVYTIRDIASRAGVGISTVSRALNNRSDVGEETRQKIMRIVEELGYAPNANAKNLKQRASGLSAIIVRGRRNGFLTGIAEQMTNYGWEMGHQYLIEFIDERGEELDAAFRLVAEKKLEGIFFLGSNVVGRRTDVLQLGIPCVFVTVDASLLNAPGVSSVSVDNRACGRMAVERLIASGHRKIAVIGGREGSGDGIGLRFKGAMDALESSGLRLEDSLYTASPFSMEGAYRAAQELLSKRRDFSALFAMSDVMAIGAMRALRETGLLVPKDVSVIGFDGIELASFTQPPLATVEQPAVEIARAGVELMTRLLENPNDCEYRIVEGKLIEGGSVRVI